MFPLKSLSLCLPPPTHKGQQSSTLWGPSFKATAHSFFLGPFCVFRAGGHTHTLLFLQLNFLSVTCLKDDCDFLTSALNTKDECLKCVYFYSFFPRRISETERHTIQSARLPPQPRCSRWASSVRLAQCQVLCSSVGFPVTHL